ncbi:MAG: hypothetical protein EKK61_02425, partial [Rickettsiales bacterium]
MTDSIITIENKFDKSPEELLKLYPHNNNSISNRVNNKKLDAIIAHVKNTDTFHLYALLNKDHEALQLLSKEIMLSNKIIKSTKLQAICYNHFYQELSQATTITDHFSEYLNTQKIILIKKQYMSFNDFKSFRNKEIAQLTQKFSEKSLKTINGRKEYNKQKATLNMKFLDLLKTDVENINKNPLNEISKKYTNDNASKAVLNFIKALYSADNNETYFEESVVSFNQYLKNMKQGGEIPSLYLYTITYLMKLYTSDQSFELCREVYNLYNRKKSSFDDTEKNILVERFCNASSNFTDMGHHSHALYNSKIAYDICQQNPQISKKNCFISTYNFAIMIDKFTIAESLKYYDEAEQLINNHLDLIDNKILGCKKLLAAGYTHIRRGDFEIKINDLIQSILNNINDDQFKKLYNLSFDSKTSDKDFLQQYEQIEKLNIGETFLKTRKENLLLLNKAKYNILKNNLDEGLRAYNELFTISKTTDKENIILYSTLMLCVLIESTFCSDEKILNFYDNLTKNNSVLKNHLSAHLKFMEFLLYNQHDREKEAIAILEFLNVHTSFREHNNRFADYANEIYISTKFNEGKFQEALEYVKSGKLFDKDA